MRTLGLLGGMSWESTIPYYRLINEAVRDRCGGLHSARLLLCSVDFAPIEIMMREDRWSLVGLELLEPEKKLRGGAILFAANDEIKGHGRGYVTSVTWSTDLSMFIALGLYQGGLTHENEEVIAAFPLKDEQVRLRIVSPHFIDRQGTRLNA